MTKEEIIRNLKYTMEKHKNDIVNTFDTNISVMCKDILDYFEEQESCDAISREAVLSLWGLRLSDKEIYMAIHDMPLVTPSRRKGHWIPNEYFYGIYDYTCSECEKHSKECSEFCPKCGVEMEIEE